MAKGDKIISAADFLPKEKTIPSLREAAKHCHGCHLYQNATQTVFGDGPGDAELMIVGEIAGEKEDELGKPFVGPAGKFLRKTIAMTSLNVEDIYFTNVVKHFKFTYMNKRKLHRSPVAKEIKACMPWLETEIEVIQPKVILCLGAIAAKALVDKQFHLREQRGIWYKYTTSIKILVTFHPSAILRARDSDSRHEMRDIFLKDIKKIARILGK